jgi:dTDP-glucose 4,6-dehydratase
VRQKLVSLTFNAVVIAVRSSAVAVCYHCCQQKAFRRARLLTQGGKFMRVLVTGGAGFLGSHICDRLIAEGHTVICLDSLLTGREKNIAYLLDHPRFVFFRYDITQPFYIAEKVDWVLHFASPASPKDYAANPIHTLKVGGLGTYHMLGLAKAHKAKFLLASTSEVYGDPEVHPQPESYWGHVNPIGPRSCYDEAKRFAEALTMAYWRQHGVDVRIVRIFNTVGPRMRIDDGRVFPTFITQALKGEPITVYGDGSQTRSFCYVDDLIEGIMRVMEWTPPETGDELDRVFNLGNPEEITVLEFAHLVKEVTGSESPIVFCPLPKDDPRQRRPDITKARTVLGWQPKVSLREALERTIPYFRQELGLQ